MGSVSGTADSTKRRRVRGKGVDGTKSSAPTSGSDAEAGGDDSKSKRPTRNVTRRKNATGDARKKQARKVRRSNWRSKRVIAFIEKLIVPSGEGQGKPFKLREWQRKFIRDVYDSTDGKSKLRVVRRAILSVGRKNGKTALIAALVLCHLVGPEAIPNGEIYSAANEREQAAIVFKFAAQLVRADDDLLSMLKVVDSTKTIVCLHNGSVYRALSSEVGSKHGLNPSLIIYDELSQAKSRELYDVLDTSQGARLEPLFITISTQNPDPEHILSQLIDDGLRADDPSSVCHLYAVSEEVDDIFDEREWRAANPALGDFRSLEDMRTQAKKAQRLPSFETAFRNLYLNQRIDASSPLIPRAEWKGCEHKDAALIPGEDIFLGLDLSTTNDLTALVAVSAGSDERIRAWFWKPGDTIREHEDRDRAPYSLWVKKGWIEPTPGRSVQYEFVAERIAQIAAEYNIKGLAFDRWRMEYLLPHLANAGLDPRKEDDTGGLRMVPWGQGWKDMSPAIDALETSILERNFKHDGNPVLAYCFANAQAVTDPAGNRKLDKSKTRLRIDGAVACAMAIGLKLRDHVDEVDLTDFLSDPVSL